MNYQQVPVTMQLLALASILLSVVLDGEYEDAYCNLMIKIEACNAMLLYPELVAAVASRFCPPGYRPIGEGCYFYGHFRLNWFRAMEFCHSFGKVGSRPVSGV